MIKNDVTEEAVHHQTLLGARPIATNATITSLFDTFKIKNEESSGKNTEDLATTVATVAADLHPLSVGNDGVDDVPFDVLATRRFTSLKRSNNN